MSKLANVLAVIPAMIIMTITNVFITFTVAGTVLIQLLSNNVNRYLSLTIAIVVAVIVNFYIAFNYKIRAYINKHSQGAVDE